MTFNCRPAENLKWTKHCAHGRCQFVVRLPVWWPRFLFAAIGVRARSVYITNNYSNGCSQSTPSPRFDRPCHPHPSRPFAWTRQLVFGLADRGSRRSALIVAVYFQSPGTYVHRNWTRTSQRRINLQCAGTRTADRMNIQQSSEAAFYSVISDMSDICEMSDGDRTGTAYFLGFYIVGLRYITEWFPFFHAVNWIHVRD